MKRPVWFIGLVFAASFAMAEETRVQVELEKGFTVQVDDTWLKSHGLKSNQTADIRSELLRVDVDTGFTEWQKWVLNASSPEFFSISSISNASDKWVVSFPQYGNNGFSQVYLQRYLKKMVGTTISRTKAQTATASIPKNPVEPLAIYEIELAFYNRESSVTNYCTSANKIGVLYATPSTNLSILGVPWRLVGGAPMTAAQFVDVSGLSDGDMLRVYDKDGQRYQVWRVENGRWVGVKMYSILEGGVIPKDTSDPSQVELTRGDGVWLERKQVNTAICRIGEWVEDAPAMPKLETGWNLIGNSGTTMMDVTSQAKPTDEIIIPTEGAPKRYLWNQDEQCWGRYIETERQDSTGVKIKSSTFSAERALLNPGEGCWLIRAL